MARCDKKKSSAPNNSYMISFGDTMTALLAFFIVLNQLASEQTGTNLYSGTGSFIRATDALGVPGIFPEGRSLHAIQLHHSTPHYQISTDDEPNSKGSGPDEINDNLLLRDREQQDFERMLNELERLHSAVPKTDIAGEVVFDQHKKISKEAPYLNDSLKTLLIELRTFLMRKDSEAEIIVWTPTPSPSAWTRSTQIAAEIQQETSQYLQLNRSQANRIQSSSRQWNSAELKRPAISIAIRRNGPSK